MELLERDMRRLVLIPLALFLMGAAPNRTQTYTSGEVINPSEVTENEDNIYSYLQAGVDTIKDGSVVTADLADSAVTTVKIAANAVTATSLASTAVTAGSYGSATAVPTITIDADGRITSASNTSITTAESGTWSNVTGSRALSTVYQNTGGKKRRVMVEVDGDANSRMEVGLQVDSVNPPTAYLINRAIHAASTNGASHKVELYWEVPNNWYYQIGVSFGTNTLQAWYELDE